MSLQRILEMEKFWLFFRRTKFIGLIFLYQMFVQLVIKQIRRFGSFTRRLRKSIKWVNNTAPEKVAADLLL